MLVEQHTHTTKTCVKKRKKKKGGGGHRSIILTFHSSKCSLVLLTGSHVTTNRIPHWPIVWTGRVVWGHWRTVRLTTRRRGSISGRVWIVCWWRLVRRPRADPHYKGAVFTRYRRRWWRFAKGYILCHPRAVRVVIGVSCSARKAQHPAFIAVKIKSTASQPDRSCFRGQVGLRNSVKWRESVLLVPHPVIAIARQRYSRTNNQVLDRRVTFLTAWNRFVATKAFYRALRRVRRMSIREEFRQDRHNQL